MHDDVHRDGLGGPALDGVGCLVQHSSLPHIKGTRMEQVIMVREMESQSVSECQQKHNRALKHVVPVRDIGAGR